MKCAQSTTERTVKALLPFTDQSRTLCAPVWVEKTRAWATDGHRAVILHGAFSPAECGPWAGPAKGKTVRLDESLRDTRPPPIDQVMPPPTPEHRKALPAKLSQELRKAIKCFSPYATVALQIEDATPTLTATAGSWLHPSAICTCPLVNPAGEVPECDGALSLCINARYLLSAIDVLAMKDTLPIPFEQTDEYSPIRFETKRGIAIVMPMRR